MNKSRPFFTVGEGKIKAAILLKSLHSTDEKFLQRSVKRFHRLNEFKNATLAQLIQQAKLKHALHIVALEKGFSSWSELKCQLPFICGGFLTHWFTNYEDAKSYQTSQGGFLLPYQHQFFVCNSDYIQSMGLDPRDPDWKLIAHDWAKPQNNTAFKRLYQKWTKLGK